MLHTLIIFFIYTYPTQKVGQTSLFKGPMVQWTTEQTHDFGSLPRKKPVTHVFGFKNISDQAISIETVRTTCGCTAVEWTEDAILPGGEGTVSVEYDAYKSGAFRKKITVFFKQQRKAETLWISGEVED